MEENKLTIDDNANEKSLLLIESALYVTGRPLGLKTLGSLLEIRSKKTVLETARNLVDVYISYDSALEILELKDERFVMQVKADFAPRTRRFSQQPNLTTGPLRTLSYIAYNQPIFQTKVIEARGGHAYRHLKLLEENNLIIRKGVGRTQIIRTTDYFADYFGLSHDSRALKRQIKKLFFNK
jgi:segregation and condensation protein B